MERNQIVAQINELTHWFAEYDKQVCEYYRCQRLGTEFDKDIVELDNLAETKKVQLKELRAELSKK